MANKVSIVNVWIKPSQLDARILGLEPPVCRRAFFVSPLGPSRGLFFHDLFLRNPPGEALPGHRAVFDLGPVQPTAVLGGVVKFEPPGQSAGLLRSERFGANAS